MDLNKKKGVIIGIVVVVILLYNFGGNITGDVVWEPSTVVNNCSESDILDLWDEVFLWTLQK